MSPLRPFWLRPLNHYPSRRRRSIVVAHQERLRSFLSNVHAIAYQLLILQNIRFQPRISHGALLDLSTLSKSDCFRKFRFSYEQICELSLFLEIPESFVARTYRVQGFLAFAMLLYRLSGCRSHHDIGTFFHIDKSYSCTIISALVTFLYQRWHSLIEFNRPRVLANVERYANAIHDAGAPLDNCIGRYLCFTYHPRLNCCLFRICGWNKS